MNKVTYVVSGFMRTGTTAMMQALEAGGMEVAYSKEKDKFLQETFAKTAKEGYKPNPGSYFELSKEALEEDGFPSKYLGKVIKVINAGLRNVDTFPNHIYRVVFMLRNPEEIFASHLSMGHKGPLDLFTGYEKIMSWRLRHLANRRDVASIAIVEYEELIKDPIKIFNLLVEHSWPINPEAAAKVIDPKLHRHKVEDLGEMREEVIAELTKRKEQMEKENANV